jgi:hypothetical protein
MHRGPTIGVYYELYILVNVILNSLSNTDRVGKVSQMDLDQVGHVLEQVWVKDRSTELVCFCLFAKEAACLWISGILKGRAIANLVITTCMSFALE